MVPLRLCSLLTTLCALVAAAQSELKTPADASRHNDAPRRVEIQPRGDPPQQAEERGGKKKDETKKSGPEPELNLPIRYFVYAALLGGLGYATGIFSAGPERELRNPDLHPTREKTQELYVKAYYGGIVSRAFYGASATMTAYASYRVQAAIRDYLQAKAQAATARRSDPTEEPDHERAPRVRAGFAFSPGEAGLVFSASF